jgi:hypothetical protein
MLTVVSKPHPDRTWSQPNSGKTHGKIQPTSERPASK